MSTTTKPATHTPGPWTCNLGDGSNLTYDCTIWGDDCRVTVCAIGDESRNYSTAVDIANARLIAAAPDLLAALVDAVDILDRLAPPIQLGTLCEEQDHAAAMRSARAAIAKATCQP